MCVKLVMPDTKDDKLRLRHDEPELPDAMECALLSETSLAEDWNRPEEDEAWLQADNHMNHKRERYVKLAPWSTSLEKNIALLAVYFFDPKNYFDVCEVIGKKPNKGAILPMTSHEFLQFLDKSDCLDEKADKYIYQIRYLLMRLAYNNILVEMGSSNQFVLLPKSYYASCEVSLKRSKGILWLAKALGGKFIHREVSTAIVHIVGVNQSGNARALPLIRRNSSYIPLYLALETAEEPLCQIVVTLWECQQIWLKEHMKMKKQFPRIMLEYPHM